MPDDAALKSALPGPGENMFVRMSQTMVRFCERWFPDAYIFVLVAALAVGVGTLAHGGDPLAISTAFGDGFWSLIPFTMQMALVAVGGYVVAQSPPVAALMRRAAAVPSTGRGAVVFVGVVSILLSLVNWGVSLIFSGLLVREIARRNDIRLDYRAAGAAGYLGLGFGFTLGISSSAAQLQATAASIPASLMPITGVIGFGETILTWQCLLIIVVGTVLSATICRLTTPSDSRAVTAAELGINLVDAKTVVTRASRPGDFLEFSPILTLLTVLLAAGWLYTTFKSGNPLITMSNLNTYNFVFLLLGALLHWRPRSFLLSFAGAMPSVAGVLLQFPFYGGIAFMLTRVNNGSGLALSDTIAHWFVSLAHDSGAFSFIVGIYSAVLGFFIPSAGGKWVVEAPYIMKAANEIHAHLGWTVMVYNLAETLPNFINPFWMLPLLGVLGLKSKDLVGYTSMQFFIHFPIVMLLATVLSYTFTYHPPVL